MTHTQASIPPAARPALDAAVLYVCAERGKLLTQLGTERAEAEGRAFAGVRGLRITEVITDPFGEADPLHHEGWVRVRELARAGTVGTVIVRWPAVIAPDASHKLRHREISWLQDHGVRVRYSWAPLATVGGEMK